MDQKKIEEGLKRLERAVAVEKEEKLIKKQEEEKQEQEEGLDILSREEEDRQNAALKEQFPDDICPVCGVHVTDARYLIIPGIGGGVVCCGNCYTLYMPKSRYFIALGALESAIEEASRRVQPVKAAAIPKITT